MKNRYYLKSKAILPLIISVICAALSLFGCRKYVEVPAPTTQLTSSTVFADDATAAAAMNYVYVKLVLNTSSGLAAGTGSIGLRQGLAADELKNYSTDPIRIKFYTNNLDSKDTYYWSDIYQLIYSTNAVLEGVEKSDKLSESMKNQLIGEAKFMRAFLYFYTVELFGEVPVATTTDFRTNSLLSRSSVDDVYAQIISDLKDAQSLLKSDYMDPAGLSSSIRVRPNLSAATALLARVYLYRNNFADAEKEASKVISDNRYKLEEDLNDVFKLESQEVILQLQSVQEGLNTADGYSYILTSAPGSQRFPVALSSQMLDAFESKLDDKRFLNWVGNYKMGSDTYYYPLKYKIGTQDQANPITEYTTLIRLAEIYLIRAEARARQNNVKGFESAESDLNVIRHRAGLSDTKASAQPEMLEAILKERRVELFTEWGHRWFDLKRTNHLDDTMTNIISLKGGTWASFKKLLPIPQTEIQKGPNLKQTPGYQ